MNYASFVCCSKCIARKITGAADFLLLSTGPTLDGTRNPLSVLIPCHRVVGAGGTLTGYAGGLDKKAWLLAHEGAAAGGK